MQRRIFWSMLAVMGVALFIALATTSVLRQRAVDDRARELARQATVTASLLDEQLANRIGADQRSVAPRIRVLLEQVRRIGGHDFLEAAVVTDRGIVEPLVPDSPLLESIGSEANRLAGSDATQATLETEVRGAPIIATLQLVEPGGATALLVAIGREEPLLRGGEFGPRAWLAFAVGAVLAAVLAAVLSRRIGRRLEIVRGAAGRIASGDFAARADVEGDDDVAALAASFNDMAADLEASRTREREFLLSVGHDLRTPLTTIRGYAEGLHSGVIAPDDLQRVAGVLDTQTTRLSRLLEDLMLLARLESREFSVRREDVDLAALVRGLVEAERSRAAGLGLALSVDVADVGTVAVDPDRFGQALGNLLDNAFRYSPEGTTVTVSLRDVGTDVELRVADNGPGIEESDLDRVFERLYVAQRYQPLRPEGSGLGLSIVRELVAAHGGMVAAESVVGHGTTLVVRLPTSDGAP